MSRRFSTSPKESTSYLCEAVGNWRRALSLLCSHTQSPRSVSSGIWKPNTRNHIL